MTQLLSNHVGFAVGCLAIGQLALRSTDSSFLLLEDVDIP